MLHVPSMEGLELGSDARMPLDVCRPVTMCLAADDTKPRLLNETPIARLCMRLLIAVARIEALCLCLCLCLCLRLRLRLRIRAVLAEEAWTALPFFGASAPC